METEVKKVINNGYIMIARQMFQSPVMAYPPLWFKLWVWMIGKANHQTVVVKGQTFNRGELLTSYDEMIEVGSYSIGWRKMKPKKADIENYMKMLKNTAMITTRKTTAGLFISISKYDYFQDPENYTENVTKATRKPQTTDTINNKENNENNDIQKAIAWILSFKGDNAKLVNESLYVNGVKINDPVAYKDGIHKTPVVTGVSTNPIVQDNLFEQLKPLYHARYDYRMRGRDSLMSKLEEKFPRWNDNLKQHWIEALEILKKQPVSQEDIELEQKYNFNPDEKVTIAPEIKQLLKQGGLYK